MSAKTIKLDARERFIGLHLIAAMAWPDSESARALASAGFGMHMIAELQDDRHRKSHDAAMANYIAAGAKYNLSLDELRTSPSFYSDLQEQRAWLETDLLQSIESNLILPAGGARALSEKPAYSALISDMKAQARKGFYAGRMLLLTAKIQEFHPQLGASLTLVEAVINDRNKPPSQRLSDVTTMQYWKKWRCVAPIHAAYLNMIEQMSMRGLHPVEHSDLLADSAICSAIVGWAQWFATWGTTYKAEKAQSPLLPAEDVIAISSPQPPRKPKMLPLSPAELQRAEAVRTG